MIDPVQVGVRSQAQVHHYGDGPGLLGAAIYSAISGGSARYAQSPEQGGGCHGSPKLLGVCWPSRHQLMLVLLPYLAFRMRWLAWIGGVLAGWLPLAG